MNPSKLKKWLSLVFNTSILEKSRLAWVDYLKGIAILLVVYRHVLIGLQRSSFSIPIVLEKANMIFFSFRMPLFFILSGIFINSSLAKRTLKKLLFIKFENLIYPYLVWSVIQISLQIGLSHFTNSDRTIRDYTLIFYQPRGLDQFWYLPALFNTTLIYLLLKTKLHIHTWTQILFGILFYFISHLFHSISLISDWMEFYVFFALGDAISKIFFEKKSQFVLNNYKTLLILLPLFIITQVVYLTHQPDYYTDSILGRIEFLPIVLIGCFCMFALAFQLQKKNILRFLRVLGYHSLFIYVMHVIVSAFVRIILTRIFFISNPVVLLLCGIATGVTIPVIIYNTIIRNGPGWFLFSLERPKKIKTEKKNIVNKSLEGQII